MADLRNDKPTKLLWMDLEFTGLDPVKQRIIEVSALVTDFELNELARYEAVIHQDEAVLQEAEEWPKQNMQDLFEEVRNSTQSEEAVISDLVKLVKDNFREEPAILAGNSIHQDRLFIRQWWGPVEELLHYRMLDVSTLKIWLNGTKGVKYDKQEAHRALDDVIESIEELKWALAHLSDK